MTPARFSLYARDDWRRNATWGAVLGLLVAVAALLLPTGQNSGSTLENGAMDLCFRWRGAAGAQPSGQVVIFEIDRPTLRRWNGRVFDATEIARLLDLLRQSGVRASVLTWGGLDDAVLSESDLSTLAMGLETSRNSVIPLRITPPGRRAAEELGRPPAEASITRFAIGTLPETAISGVVPDITILRAPPETLLDRAAGAGHLRMITDADGRVRRTPVVLEYGGRVYPSLALSGALVGRRGVETDKAPFQLLTSNGRPASLERAREIRTGSVGTPLLPGAQMLLNYPPVVVENGETTAPFRTISVGAALDNPALLQDLNDCYAVIGPTADGVAAQYATPDGGRVTGTVLQAIALDNLLTGRAIERAPLQWTALLTLLLGAIAGGFAATRPPLWSAMVAMLCLAVATTISLGLFEGDMWLDTSMPWLATGGAYLGGLILRARRQERESTRVGSTIEALGQVGDIIAGQSRPEQVIDRVLQWTEDVMRAEGASVLLLDESRSYLRFAAATGPKAIDLHTFNLQLGEGIAGWVALNGRAAIVNDVASDPRFARSIAEKIEFPARSILCVPMRARDSLLGVIEAVNRADGRPFTEEDAELLTAVANQAALFLENARLLEQLNTRVLQTESDLARTNARLQAEKSTLQTVVGSLTDGVIVTDKRGVVHLVNPAATRLLSVSPQSLGKPLTGVMADLDAAEEIPGMQGARVLRRESAGRMRQLEARRAPLLNAEGLEIGTVWVFSDATEERDIAQAKSDFVAYVAHEMRSPLTSIAGFSSLLEGTADVERMSRYLKIIRSETERLKRLINNLLDVSRIEAGRGLELQRENCDFAAIARDVGEAQSAYASDHVISFDLPDELPTIHADRDKVAQILINLVSNALKYTPGGAITVGARATPEWLEAWVSDEGPGIEPAVRERLFQRYGAVGAAGVPSTGLGLFLTKYLVEEHGGRIDVLTEPPAGSQTAAKGATFRFTLPLAKDGIQ